MVNEETLASWKAIAENLGFDFEEFVTTAIDYYVSNL